MRRCGRSRSNDNVADYIGVSSADQVCEWDKVGHVWLGCVGGELGRGQEFRGVLEGRNLTKGLEARYWVAMCFMGSELLTCLEACFGTHSSSSSSPELSSESLLSTQFVPPRKSFGWCKVAYGDWGPSHATHEGACRSWHVRQHQLPLGHYSGGLVE